MAKNRIPEEVATAMKLAREAGWGVSIRNEKIVISAPDGKALTIGMNPNDHTIKEWRSNARSYNLIEGPARTPEEAAQLIAEAEAAGEAQAEAANKKRQEYEAEQAKKKAATKAAALKAEAVTAKGLVSAVTDKSSSALPEFREELLGTMSYSEFQLPDGRLYCIECLQVGKEFIAKMPQGLATHRGFRHQMYPGEGSATPSNPVLEISRVSLPNDIQDAIDLLRSVVGDHVNTPDDSARVAELEALLEEVKKKSAAELASALESLSTAREAAGMVKDEFDKVLAEQKARVHELTQELHGKDGMHKAEVEGLLVSVRHLLKEIREAVNNLSPAQAVGKVDELVSSYLGG